MSTTSKSKNKTKRRGSAPERNSLLVDKALAETTISSVAGHKDAVDGTGHRDVYGLIPASPPSHVDGGRNKRVIVPNNYNVASSQKNVRISAPAMGPISTPLMNQDLQSSSTKSRVVIDGIANVRESNANGSNRVEDADENDRNAAPLPTVADRRSRTTPLLLASSVTSNTSMTDETAHSINHNLLAPLSPSTLMAESPPLPPLGPTPAKSTRSNKSNSPSGASSSSNTNDRVQNEKISVSAGNSTTELAHAALHGGKLPQPPPKISSPAQVPASTPVASTPADRRRDQLPPPMTGIFYKRRDVFQKQWRPRFFVLNPLTGMLSYYLLPSVPWPAASTTEDVISSVPTSSASGRQRTYTEESQLTTSSLGSSKQGKKKDRHAKNRRKNGSPRKRKNVRLEASLNASNQRAQAALALQNTSSTTKRSSEALPVASPPLTGDSRNSSTNDATNLVTNTSGDTSNNVGLPVSSSSSVADGQQEGDIDNDSSSNAILSSIPAIAGPPRGSIFLPGCHVYVNEEKTKTLQQRFDSGRYVTANHDSFDKYGKAGRRTGRKQRRGRNKEQQKRQRLSSTDSLKNEDEAAMELDLDDSTGAVERYPYTYVLTIAVIPPTSSTSSNNQSGTMPPGSPNSTNTANPSAYTGQHLAAKTKEERDRWVKALKAVSNWMDYGSQLPSSLPESTNFTPSRTSASAAIPEEPTPVESSDESDEDDDESESDYDDEEMDDDEDANGMIADEENAEDDGYERDVDGDDVDATILDRSSMVISGGEDNDEVLGAGLVGSEEITKESIVQKFASVFDEEADNASSSAASETPSYFKGVPEELRQVIETKVDQLLTTTGHKVSAPPSSKQQSPWKTIQHDDKVVAKMKPYEHNDKLFTVRVDATVGGNSPEERITMGQLVDCLLNGSKWTKRTKPDLTSSKIVKVFNAHTYVMHECVRAVWPTTARDYLLVVHWRVLPTTKQVIVCGFSHPFPDICPPNPKTHVRADIVQGGNILSPISSLSAEEANGDALAIHGPIKFQRVVTMDLKGNIPNPILQMAQKKLAGFPTVVEQALLERNRKASSPCPAHLNMPIECNEDLLAHCVWHIPELRKRALAVGASSTTSAKLPRRLPVSSLEAKEKKKSLSFFAAFKTKLATRIWTLCAVLIQTTLFLVVAYYLVTKSILSSFPVWSLSANPSLSNATISHDQEEYNSRSTSIEGAKRICTVWVAIVLWMSGIASKAGREPKSAIFRSKPRNVTDLITSVQLRLQQRTMRLIVPVLLLLPPIMWFGLIRQALSPNSMLWQVLDGDILVEYYAKDLKYRSSQIMMDGLIFVIIQLQSLVVTLSSSISPRHEIFICTFATWYIVRWFVSRRLQRSTTQFAASHLQNVARTGQVTCRFQVDVKGALRYISHQKELQQEEAAKAKKLQKKRLKAQQRGSASDSALDPSPHVAKVVITHIVVKAVALALQEIPELISEENSNEVRLPWLRLRGTPRKMKKYSTSSTSSIPSVQVGVSTGFTPGGSKYVVIDSANQLPVRQIASETKRLVEEQKSEADLVEAKGRTNVERPSFFEQFVDRLLIHYLGFKDPTTPIKGAALVMTSPNSEHNHVEMDVTPAELTSNTGGCIPSSPSIIVVVGGVRISRDTKTGVSRPMIGISIGFDMNQSQGSINAAHPGHCRKLAERVQRLLTFPELCDVPPANTNEP